MPLFFEKQNPQTVTVISMNNVDQDDDAEGGDNGEDIDKDHEAKVTTM